MRLPASCLACAMARLDKNERTDDLPVYLLDLTDDGAYSGMCDQGHSIKFALQNLHYELLYESGIVAMFCGFHREAVADMATALERFLEFAVHVLLAHQGVEHEHAEAAWKEVASSSERQLGAFLFLYLSQTKKPFAAPEARRTFKKMSEFRNDVVHKGKIPSRAQAEEYAQDVFGIVRRIRVELLALDRDKFDIIEARFGSLRGRKAFLKNGKPVPDADGLYRSSTAVFGMMLSDVQTDTPKEFDARLELARGRLEIWGHADCAE